MVVLLACSMGAFCRVLGLAGALLGSMLASPTEGTAHFSSKVRFRSWVMYCLCHGLTLPGPGQGVHLPRL